MRQAQRIWSAPGIFVISLFISSVVNAQEDPRQFYELRIYRIDDAEKQSQLSNYLRDALVPALNRMGIDGIGVFRSIDTDDHSLFVLIPFDELQTFANLNDALSDDLTYQSAAKQHFDRPLKDPVYQRIESRLLKAFAGMPMIERPVLSESQSERIFELRLYESHTEDHARRKVKMFNEGEIQLMRDVELGPVFFGETLVGHDVPNLVYMLSAANRQEHQEHWRAFLEHPAWEEMKNLEEYQDTVSRIENWFLEPLEFSDL